MQDKDLYEYAVLRVVPKVEREEFINVGVFLFCKKKKYLKLKYHLNTARLNAFCNELDIPFLEENLEAINKVCIGGKAGGPIGAMEVPSRFRWLTAVRSSCIQSSKTHGGYTEDLDDCLEKLFNNLVL